jgi:chromosome segregation ATPase
VAAREEGKRRATDHPPLSEIVTKGNLDDRLETVNTRFHDHQELATERWSAHREVHAVVAESLREYKKDANEWRSTLQDLRLTFIPKAEYLAEHRALEAKLHGEISNLVSKLDTLDTRVDLNSSNIQSINDQDKTTKNVLTNGRNAILLALSIIGGLIGLLIFLKAPVG